MWMPASDDRPARPYRAQRDGDELARGREHHGAVARRRAAARRRRRPRPRRARVPSARWPSPRVSTHDLAAPVPQHLHRPGGRRTRSRSARRARPARSRPGAARGSRPTPAQSSGDAREVVEARRADGREVLGHGDRLGVAAVDGPAGERRPRSQRFSCPRRQNWQTPSAQCSQRTPTRSPTRRRVDPSPSGVDTPDDLVAGHDGQRGEVEIAVDDVQVGAAAAHTLNSQPHLAAAPARARSRSTSSSGRVPIGAGALDERPAPSPTHAGHGTTNVGPALDRGAAVLARARELEVDRRSPSSS